MYSPLIRRHLEVKNDTVLFLPFYDSTERAQGRYYQKVRLMLKNARYIFNNKGRGISAGKLTTYQLDHNRTQPILFPFP